MKSIIDLGMVDGYNIGKRSCKATFEIRLKKGNLFSMSANVWNYQNTDVIMYGQCCDNVLSLCIPKTRRKYKKLVELWKKWHLNDLNAGTEEQEKIINDYLKKHNIKYNYTLACKILKQSRRIPTIKEIILSFTEKICFFDLFTYYIVTVDKKLYKYGHRWLKRKIPANDLFIIKTFLNA